MGIALTAQQMARILRVADKKNRQILERAQRLTSRRIVQFLKSNSPVFDGLFKNAWQGSEMGVWNDAPYAGVIERGARPHPVSEEGQAAIAEWVRRKLLPGASDAEVRSTAFLICRKIREHGQKGTFLVRDNIPRFVIFLREEIERQLDRAAKEGL